MIEKQKIAESLSPHERKILPYLEEGISDICQKTNLDRVAVLRALEYLQNKGLINLVVTRKKIVDVGVNGALYRKKGLPERRLLNIVAERRIVSLEDAQKESELSDDEFKASLGALKRKAMIDLKNGKLVLSASSEEISKKTLEELFLEDLPLAYDELGPEQKFALKILEGRKNIIDYSEEKETKIEILDLGKSLIKDGIKVGEMIEQISPEILKKEQNWKGKKFRRYDLTVPVSRVYGGKRHFVNQAIDYGRKLWTEMGFEEMKGDMVQTSFWNFDALFTAQDHPVREMQDTFFLNLKGELPDKKLVKAVKDSHEKGVAGSKGWKYNWNEEEAKRLVLRTHTTSLSAHTLAGLKPEDLPAKFFAIGINFRNETIDWCHGFEFLQTEGIVVDPNANFRNLLGYLKQLAKKMGFEKVRFRPSYFPYTEPSVEGDVWNEDRKEWVEVFAAGILRPEVVEPLLGKSIPVLAWGPGFGRMIMGYYDIKDLRDLYKNDLTQLRNIKGWVKV